MTKKLYIDFTSRSEGGERESDDRWSGRTPEHISLTINGVHMSPTETFAESVDTLFVPHKKMHVYLVTVRYTTGDTFGHCTGNYKFVACYDNVEHAHDLAKEIREHYELNERNYSFKPKTPYTEDEIYCGSWTGYFERLEHVEVDTFTVE